MKPKYIGIVLVTLLLTITQTNVFARRRPLKHRRRAPLRRRRVLHSPRRKVVHNRIVRQKRYIRRHDLNGDGIVNHRDKIRWINTHPVITETVIITEENENLLSDLDLNQDGSITPDEVKSLFEDYDINGDGEITEEEVSSQE